MKYLLLLSLLLVTACGAGPIVTQTELEETLASVDARSDAGSQWVLDATLNVLRQLFPESSQQIPPITLDVQPPTVQAAHEDGFDWGILNIVMASLLGTGGAVGLRALDHHRKATAAKDLA